MESDDSVKQAVPIVAHAYPMGVNVRRVPGSNAYEIAVNNAPSAEIAVKVMQEVESMLGLRKPAAD